MELIPLKIKQDLEEFSDFEFAKVLFLGWAGIYFNKMNISSMYGWI